MQFLVLRSRMSREGIWEGGRLLEIVNLSQWMEQGLSFLLGNLVFGCRSASEVLPPLVLRLC